MLESLAQSGLLLFHGGRPPAGTGAAVPILSVGADKRILENRHGITIYGRQYRNLALQPSAEIRAQGCVRTRIGNGVGESVLGMDRTDVDDGPARARKQRN